VTGCSISVAKKERYSDDGGEFQRLAVGGRPRHAGAGKRRPQQAEQIVNAAA